MVFVAHPACRPTPSQIDEVKATRARIENLIGLHLDKPWRVSRVKHLRGGLIGAWRTQDRQIIARFLGEYRMAIRVACEDVERWAARNAEADQAAAPITYRSAA